MKSVWIERFEFSDSGTVPYEVLLVFCGGSVVEVENIVGLVEAEFEKDLMPDEVLFTVAEPFFDQLTGEISGPVGNSLLNRLHASTLARVIGHDIAGRESSVARIRGNSPRINVPLDYFARRGITRIFNCRGGLVKSTSSYHFVHPSGRHTNNFVRLSNLMVNAAEINFLAFCCLPYISENTDMVYVDTPALFSIVLAVSEMRRPFNSQVHRVENFRSYADYKSIDCVGFEDAIVLISASSTGGLAQLIVEGETAPESSIAHLLYLGNQEPAGKVICDLKYDSVSNPEGLKVLPTTHDAVNCPICSSGSIAIPVQGDNFEFAGPQPQSVIIRKSDAPSDLSQTMDRIRCSEILGTGISSGSGIGLQEFYVNEKELLKSHCFKERLSFILKSKIPASCSHIIRVDDSSQELSEQAKAHLESLSGNCEIVNSPQEIAQPTESPITIVALAIESGRKLTEVSRDLRAIAPHSPLIYLVGFEKTTNLARRKALEKTLIQSGEILPHQFLTVERMVLPESSSQNSWNEELDLWQRWNAANPNSEFRKFVAVRMEQLSASSQRVANNLFLTNGPDQELTIQPGFVFWSNTDSTTHGSQADVYFTIASILQQLRANAESPESGGALRNDWFHQTKLAPENFNRFNDDVVQASLLRAAKKSELNYGTSNEESREMARVIRRIVSPESGPSGGAASEFMLAIATNRLKLVPDDKRSIVESVQSSDGILRILSEIAGSNGAF